MPVEAEVASVAAERPDRADVAPRRPAAGPRRRPPFGATTMAGVALVAVAASPVVVAALALVGDPWVPMSDWANLVFKVSQVGTRETPLVGPYSFHGFAHPGPLLYWVTAPVYRLAGEDARAVLWTGGLVNVLAITALAAVAWRRGRWPLLVGTMILVALLVHGLGPAVTADMWNPYVALLPFLLTVFLAWDAALGRRRAVVEAVLPASFAVQAHLAFFWLTLLVALWLVAWNRWGGRVVPVEGAAAPLPAPAPAPAGNGGDDGHDGVNGGSNGPGASAADDGGVGQGRAGGAGRQPRWSALRRPILVLLGLLWVGPLLDAVVDLHNPVNVAKALVQSKDTVGPVAAPALVGEHVGLTGRWLLGGGPDTYMSPRSAPQGLGLVLLLVVLAGCLHIARRRRLVDVAALATLATVLVVSAVPAASQLLEPTPSYLTEWFKVVGGLGWFAAGWTVWRVAEPAVRGVRGARAAPWRPRVAGALAVVALVGTTAWSWPEAGRLSPPNSGPAPAVRAVRTELRRDLDPNQTYRVEIVGAPTVHYTGFLYWMIEDGFDVVTSDGHDALKWGHAHRWSPGEPYDAALTVVVTTPGTPDTYEQCRDDPRFRQLLAYDALTPEERAWLGEVAWRQLGGERMTASESRRVDALSRRDVRVDIYQGAEICQMP